MVIMITDFTWLLYFCLKVTVINNPLTAMWCVLILPLIALSTAENTSASKPSDNKVSKTQFTNKHRFEFLKVIVMLKLPVF